VPFLIELAANPLTPDRTGILDLLAAIARGDSNWAAQAHAAVAAGFDALVAITKENSAIRLAAAHVLAQLLEHVNAVGPLLRGFLPVETSSMWRAGLLLLLGQAGDRSPESISLLGSALNSGEDVERLAATISIAKLHPRPLPPGAQQAMVHAMTLDHLEERFEGLLPWQQTGEIHRDDLRACLDGSARQEAADILIAEIESGTGTHNKVAALLDLLFPSAEPSPVKASELSPLQLRAVRALASALSGERRIFYSSFSRWGLPDMRRDWQNLADGRELTAVDMSLPMLADLENPQREVRPQLLKSGQRVVHRAFGAGTVNQVERTGNSTRVSVDFDYEGTKTLLLP